MSESAKPTGLALLREPFAENHIAYLPKESKKQKEEREQDLAKGTRCRACGSWHHVNAVHLEYVGHAATTHRLLDADPQWNWEPVAWDDAGLPRYDSTGGLWIKLTICGVTRLGYGHADKKPGADAGAREKEVIGDALRNAAMRFGVALDLWHKGDLHGPKEEDEGEGDQSDPAGSEGAPPAAPPAEPRRRSDAPQRAPAPAPARGPAPRPPAGKPATSVAVINGNQVKYLLAQFKGLGLEVGGDEVQAMLKRVGAKAVDTTITLEQFDRLRQELVEAGRRA